MVEVKITSNLEFSGLTSTQLERLKEALTYDNPAYANALRYSRYNNVKVPKYLYYYEMQSRTDENGKKHSVLVTPVGFDFEPILNADYTLEDLREENKVEYPPFKLQLRDTQQQARDVYMGEVQNKTLARSMLQLPTGKGKSILALSLARELGVRTLVLVHKDDLVTGWTKDAKLCFGDNFKVGLIKAKKRVIGDQVTIATVQTLSRMSEEELSKYLDQFGLVVQDECHHVGLKIFNIIGKFNSKYKIGLSATPMR